MKIHSSGGYSCNGLGWSQIQVRIRSWSNHFWSFLDIIMI